MYPSYSASIGVLFLGRSLRVVDRYQKWIVRARTDLALLPPRYGPVTGRIPLTS